MIIMFPSFNETLVYWVCYLLTILSINVIKSWREKKRKTCFNSMKTELNNTFLTVNNNINQLHYCNNNSTMKITYSGGNSWYSDIKYNKNVNTSFKKLCYAFGRWFVVLYSKVNNFTVFVKCREAPQASSTLNVCFFKYLCYYI